MWDRTSPKQLCSSFHSCPIAFMIKFFCFSSSLATATCFQTATAHANNAVKNRNIYHPNDVISIVNTVQGLNAEFLDHNAPKPPFFIGWDALMAKYFQPMPGGFTNNFFFEFDKGVCTVFEQADTPNSEAWSVIMFPTLEECQECLKICSVPSRYLRNYF